MRSFILLLVALAFVEASNIVCKTGSSSKTVTVENGDSFNYKTQKGKKYKGNTDCTSKYVMGSSCAKMSFSCTKFNINNKDKKLCKKGDKMTIKANGKTKSYCKKKKPKVTSTGDISVTFTSDTKKHSSGATCKVSCMEAATSETTTTMPTTTPGPAPNPCENSVCSVQTYYGTPDTLSLYTKNIFAIWWDPKHDHSADAEPLADLLISVRNDCLVKLGMLDPPNVAKGFYYNVYVHHGDDDLFPSGWAMGQGTDPFGLPYLTLHYSGMFSKTAYHEGFHIFQYDANSPGFAYNGDSMWYIEATAQWYTTTLTQFKQDRNLFVEAGAILGNPQLALWHSFQNHGPNDPASNAGRPGWMYGVRQYGMHTFLMFITEVMGVDKNHVADGFYANTEMLPQEYLFNKVGGQRMRNIFADWAAHNAGNMDYLTKQQLERAYLEITLAGDWNYFRPYVWSANNQGTDGWFRPSDELTARGWAYNVFNVNNTENAQYSFEFEADKTGSQGAPTFYLGRVVVMSKNGPIYSNMEMTDAFTGSVSVDLKPKDSAVFFIVASVPEFFKTHQHYSYQAKITKS